MKQPKLFDDDYEDPKVGGVGVGASFSLPELFMYDSKDRAAGGKPWPKLSDLSSEDKKCIADLVNQVVRLKEDKQEVEAEVTRLLKENSELRINVLCLEAEVKEARADSGRKDLVIGELKDRYTSQEEITRKELVELKGTIDSLKREESEHKLEVGKQLKRLEHGLTDGQAWKKELTEKYRRTRSKLKKAVAVIKVMDEEVKQYKSRTKPKVDKYCQVAIETTSTPNKRDHKKDDWTIDDNLLVSELFFKKQRLPIPKEMRDLFFLQAHDTAAAAVQAASARTRPHLR